MDLTWCEKPLGDDDESEGDNDDDGDDDVGNESEGGNDDDDAKSTKNLCEIDTRLSAVVEPWSETLFKCSKYISV